MGTLEKMQAAGLVEDDAPLTPVQETEAELVIEGDGEQEAVVADGELELDDGAAEGEQNHSSVEVPKKTLSQLRRTRREAREQVTQKDGEIASLRADLDALRRETLVKPSYVDYRTDAEFEAALLEYHGKIGAPPAPRAQPAAAPRQQAPAQGPDFSDDVNSHLDRAEKLGVNLDKFAQAERAVRTTLGEMVTDAIISSVGPGSEKAIMLIGSRPAELAKVQQLLASDPSGLKVVSHLTRMASKAQVKGKTISGAPRVSRSPGGGGQVLAPAALDKKLAALEKSGDVQGMVQLRRAQRKAKSAAS